MAVIWVLLSWIMACIVAPETPNMSDSPLNSLLAQGYEHNWVMQIGLIGFGIFLFTGILNKLLQGKGNFFSELMVLLFAMSIILSGIFAPRPLNEELRWSELEDHMHSVLSYIAIGALLVGIGRYGIMEKEKNKQLIHFALLLIILSALLVSIFFTSAPIDFQRIMSAFILLWFLIGYNKSSIAE